MTLLLALVIAFLLFFTSVTIILFLVGPTLLLRPRRRTVDVYRSLGVPTSPKELGLSFDEINVPVDDDTKLNSWLIKAGSPVKGTIIYLHGVGDSKIDGLQFAKLLHDHHFNVFLYDARRHGDSDGRFCTYGYYEKHDVSKVIDYFMTRTDMRLGKIGLFGTSMGAAVALQAASIDKRIVAVVAENSFATLRSIFDDYQKRMIQLPFHYLRNIVIVRSELMAKFRASDVSPLDAVKKISIPILFIYSENDQLIKYTYSLTLYDNATGPKEVYPIKEAMHHDTWNVAGKEYETKVLKFFERNLQ
ncbi:MAG: alpha/beta hydrolase [Ignavibacteriae bacterium]|nr:alpha/beta hydrolase [Ignavibacteria bacterium]MBI3364656.1 alpha/beta hydrolase [Ignavibacteriota bacterium]